MPQEGIEWLPHERIMSYEDIFFLIKNLVDLGIEKVRFTGGEPLVRKGMVRFLEKIRTAFPALRVALTTNGSFLEQYAETLACLNLDGINISLDSIIPERFSYITRGGSLERLLKGIDTLRKFGFTNLKINTVLIRGFNNTEAQALINFARSQHLTLRFIEFMPLDRSVWSEDSFIPFKEVLLSLPDQEQWREAPNTNDSAQGPARYYVHAETYQKIGVIAAVSQHFCASCNRLRITSVGEIRSCLFSNTHISIAEALKARNSSLLQRRLCDAAEQKPEAGSISTHQEERQMFKIGG